MPPASAPWSSTAPPSSAGDGTHAAARGARRGPRQFRHAGSASAATAGARQWSRSRARGGGGSDCVRASSCGTGGHCTGERRIRWG